MITRSKKSTVLETDQRSGRKRIGEEPVRSASMLLVAFAGELSVKYWN